MKPEEFEKFIKETSPFIVLRVEPAATQEEALKAYKKLALQYHPDRCTQNGLSVEQATQIMVKLNVAKEAIETGKTEISFQKEEEEKIVPEPYKQYQIFRKAFNQWYLNRIWARLDFSAESRRICQEWSEVSQSGDQFTLGMNLSWIHAYLEKRETEVLERFQESLKNTTYHFVLEYARLLKKYSGMEKVQELINSQNLHQILNENLTEESTKLQTHVSFCWRYGFEEFFTLLVEQMSLFPNTPTLITCKTPKCDQQITLVLEGNHYRVFSPYEPKFIEGKPELKPMSQDELKETIRLHFYEKEPNQPQIMSVMNFVSQAYRHSQNPNQTVPMTRENFSKYLMDILASQSEDKYVAIVKVVSRGKIKGVLGQFIHEIPVELLQAEVNELMKEHDFTTAIELIVPHPDKATQKRLIREGFRAFCEGEHSEVLELKIKVFIKMVEAFNDKGFNLANILTEEDKSHPGWICKSLNSRNMKLEYIDQLMDLGFSFPPVIAGEIGSLLIKTLSEHRSVNNQSIKEAKCLLERLISSGHRFEQPDGLEEDKYLLYLITERWLWKNPFGESAPRDDEEAALRAEKKQLAEELFTLMRQGIESGIFRLNARDNNGLTVLNHCSEAAEWDWVNYLLERGAEYTVNKKTKYWAIPPMRAKINQVEKLRFLHEKFTEAQWLALETAHFNILCACLNAPKPCPIFLNHWLTYFQESIEKNILPYLLACDQKIEQLQAVLSASQLTKQKTPIETIKPPSVSLETLYQKHVKEQIVNPNNHQAETISFNHLKGLPFWETVQRLSNHIQKPIKIVTANDAKYYLSWEDPLDEALRFSMLATLERLYVDELELLEKNQAGVLDLALIFDTFYLFHQAYQEGSKRWDPIINWENYKAQDREPSSSHHCLTAARPEAGMIVQVDKSGNIQDVETLKSPLNLIYLKNDEEHDLVRNWTSQSFSRRKHFQDYLEIRAPFHHLLETKTPLCFSRRQHPLVGTQYTKERIEERIERYKCLI